ncbi:MAG: serine protein kinase RIO [Candidatus Methanomethylicota archaeon]|uniref:non-specific serine/threonine protein kinase n=1 Tax=Thermoproteota archaeon TaxID=2056631 RepID=A0A497EYD1_9CREN|nr:MAG: serine protein kinase RIO [Candidatus Verstraetearchaeota archaeon]
MASGEEPEEARHVEFERVEKRRLKRIKDKDLYETVEEVFDRATLMALYELINRGYIEVMFGVVNSGKEARVYWAKSASGEDVAVKIYLTATAEFKRSMSLYIEGDPRFVGVKKDTRSLIYAWARKEFRNLKRAYEAGVRVPKPYAVNKNILVMEFIGEDGVPAPLLKDYLPSDLESFFDKVLEYVRLLYVKARLVHADLSEYNIMVWNDQPVFIDIGQAVLLDHPMSEQFLVRDLENLLKFFFKVGLDVPSLEEALKWVKGELQ